MNTSQFNDSERAHEKIIKNEIHELMKIDNFFGFMRISGDYLIILLSVLVSCHFPYTYPLTIILIGSRLRALENLAHEASHRQLFKNKFLNNWLGSIFCAFPIHSSHWIYQESHRRHHQYLGIPGKDPDLVKYGHLPLSQYSKTQHLLKLFGGVIDLRSNLSYFASCFTKPAFKLELAIRVFYWVTVLYLVIATGNLWSFMSFYVVPLLTTYRIIRQMVDMSEHILDSKVEHPTRNVMCHPILRFIIYPHADFLHLLHHLYPGLPGHSLLRAHDILNQKNDLNYTSVPPFTSYFSGKDSVLDSAFM